MVEASEVLYLDNPNSRHLSTFMHAQVEMERIVECNELSKTVKAMPKGVPQIDDCKHHPCVVPLYIPRVARLFFLEN
jgi:hypothetical protein